MRLRQSDLKKRYYIKARNLIDKLIEDYRPSLLEKPTSGFEDIINSSSVSKATIPLLAGIFFVSFNFIPQLAFADVFVPLHEYLGYFDANEIYTVVGNVKNESDFGVIPTITVSVIDDSKTISKNH